MQKADLLTAIDKLAEQHILVVGDVMLDEYLVGRASRLSREAPIPVLEFQTRRTIPGGAANPSMNIVALGSQASQIGLIGDDDCGQELQTRLEEAHIATDGLVIDASRCTTQKTRIVAEGGLRFPQQVARLDRLDRHPPSPDMQSKLLAQVEAHLPQSNTLLISDYGNGLLTPALVDQIGQLARRFGVMAVVDSQGRLDKYRGFDIVRANDRDTAHYLGHPLRRQGDFETAISNLLSALDAQAILIGRGADGVSLQGRDTAYIHLPALNPSEVFDVTGAGDTFTAVLALSLGGGLSLKMAALLANYAAGWVVRKQGNATPSPAGLRQAIERW